MSNHITQPKGFIAGVTAAGIKPSGKDDLVIIASSTLCAAACVTTRNQITGAPVQWIRAILPRGAGRLRGFVINAGCSNVCTGQQGLDDAREMATRVAGWLGCVPSEIAVASTGVIGHPLPMDRIRKGIDAAALTLGKDNDDRIARAILTTDTKPKTAVATFTLRGKEITIAGIAKGSGMIAPSMATMIACITTDAAVSPASLGKLLKQSVHTTFNAVTVDSDTSTSDTVLVLANGAAENATLAPGKPGWNKFTAAMQDVCDQLAKMIADDGEGATRRIEINVTRARTDRDAELAARSIADSPLVKTAVHGADPNWGRIAMAVGKSAAKVVAEKLTITLAGTKVFARGMGVRYSEKAVSKAMQKTPVVIDVDLGQGKGKYTAYTCDLSRDYITINADYTT